MAVTDKIKRDPDIAGPDEAGVAEYLEAHPDFLLRHPELLGKLELALPAGDAVSLVEKQIAILRERNTELRRRLTTLINNARENDELYEKTRRMVSMLLQADSADALAATFRKGMVQIFKVDYASVLLLDEERAAADHPLAVDPEVAHEAIGPLLKGRGTFSGALRANEFRFLFGGSGETGSAATALLRDEGREIGIIAVGSSDPHRYGSDTGTLFLSHIGDVMARLATGHSPDS